MYPCLQSQKANLYMQVCVSNTVYYTRFVTRSQIIAVEPVESNTRMVERLTVLCDSDSLMTFNQVNECGMVFIVKETKN